MKRVPVQAVKLYKTVMKNAGPIGDSDWLDLQARLGRSRFRGRFRLSPKELTYGIEKGRDTMAIHARDFVEKRLAPAAPLNDGKQTPMRGHPCFVAQHATATCCRSCLCKWHGIPEGNRLTDGEVAYVASVITRWVEQELAAVRQSPAAHLP